jgi:hypothetical protein
MKGFAGRLTSDQCVQLLTKLTEVYQDNFLIIDALDECDEKCRHSLMKALDQIRTLLKAKIKV